MKRISYRIANFILIAALLLSGAVTAHAASTTEASEKVQLRSDCTLDVAYSSEGMVFAGQDIKLWHIADITEDAQYALAGSFRSYPIQVTGTSSQSEWDEMTITLNSYILADASRLTKLPKPMRGARSSLIILLRAYTWFPPCAQSRMANTMCLNPSWRPCQGWTVRGSGCIPSPQGQK